MSERKDLVSPSTEAIACVRELADRRLTLEELNAYVSTPFSQAELEGIWESINWFCRRYPTPLKRLAYVRSAYRRWTEGIAPARGDARRSNR